jgi:hypothetical protein
VSAAAQAGQAPSEEAWVGEPAPVRRVAAMAAVAAVLAAVVAVTVLPGLAPPVPTRTGEPFLAIDPAAVREVAIETRGVAYRFVREADGWALASDAGATPVPADRLDGFLATVDVLTRLVVIDASEVRLADFGLDPPRATIALRGGDDVVLALGDRNPPLTALYVQVLPRANIVLVGAVLLWEFDKLVALARAQSVEP